MGKKTAENPPPRRHKQKRKEMFTELATHQEAIVQEQRPPTHHHHRRVVPEDSEESVQLEVLEHQNKNLDNLCETVHKLLAKNKVSAKNAFNVPLIDLEQLPDFTESLENQYAWKRLSSTLESDYKIYGYRVDAIHTITYNILNTMSRRQQDIESLQNNQSTSQPQIDLQPLNINEEEAEGQFLEKKIENLNLTELELVMRMDPVLERTKRQFDLLGQNAMIMMDRLPLDEMLGLQLARKNQGGHKYPAWGTYTSTWKVDDPLMAFFQLSRFRNQMREVFHGQMCDQLSQIKMEQDMAYLFLQQKENYLSGNHPLDHPHSHNKRSIAEEIHLRYPIFRNQQDIVEDAEQWMGDVDRKFLGYNPKKNLIKQQQFQTKLEMPPDPADIVDFDLDNTQSCTRNQIFKPDADKMEHREDIEDRFLLTMKMQTPFDLNQHRLFLKEEEPLSEIEEPQQIKQAEVDVRRQMVSILEAKRKIKEQIHQRSTFRTIYQNYCHDHEISPALCFLTILHLANECDLSLKEIDETNFYVH